jgi:hypothetical protein
MSESLKCRKCKEEVRTFNEPCPECGDKKPWQCYSEELEDFHEWGKGCVGLYGCLWMILGPIALIGGFLAWPVGVVIVVLSIFIPKLFPNFMKWIEKKTSKW